jgi:predicted branched-subunit amino acid permease
MTDATFAVHTVRFMDAPPRRIEVFTTHIVGHAAWMAGTALGVVVGSSAIDFERFAIDFAMPAMFLALLLPLVRKRSDFAVAIIAGGLAIALNLAGFGNWTTLTATVLTVTVVRGGEIWIKARSS